VSTLVRGGIRARGPRSPSSLILTRHFLDIGANASAEEAAEDLDDTVTKVNNIVSSFRLQSTSFDKKSFLTYLKGKKKPRAIASIPYVANITFRLHEGCQGRSSGEERRP
jgi:hypothetical protein